MPAFLIHKLVVIHKRRDPAKKEKDLRQAKAVAKAVARDQKQLETLRRYFTISDMHTCGPAQIEGEILLLFLPISPEG